MKSNVIFKGLLESIISILSSTTELTVKNNRDESYKIRRRQLVIVPVYAFTDYKAQGQTK